MKLLACASYDYMKLMVLELQQQLAELEESERLAASSTTATTTLTATTNGLSSSTGEEAGTEPKPLPRQRPILSTNWNHRNTTDGQTDRPVTHTFI